MIHKCNNCEYQSPYKANYRRHIANKHGIKQPHVDSTPSQAGNDGRPSHEQKYFCSFCNFRTHKKYNLEMYKKNKHGNSPIPPHAENEKHARKGSMTKDELRNMITESFDVFQEYMKIKMQPTGAGSEEMIEESIDAFKCYMLKKINE